MTKAEWLACTEPNRMFDFLTGKVSDRKLRLFAVGWCLQTVGGDLSASFPAAGGGIDHQSEAANATVVACRHAIGTAERLADGQASEAERAAAEEAVRHLPDWGGYDLLLSYMQALASWAVTTHRHPTLFLPPKAPYAAGSSGDAADARDRSRQVALLHDIVGDPFRCVTFAAAWASPAVVSLAQTVYVERAFDRMSELADALEQAGCSNASILDHCRGPGPHVRGCWAVDLVLGKS